MHHFNIQVALLCFLITLGLQAAWSHVPAPLLQAARVVQVLLGIVAIYFLATAVLGHGTV